MKASELVAKLNEVIAAQGDVNVYHNDMAAFTGNNIMPVTDPCEPEKHGMAYIPPLNSFRLSLSSDFKMDTK